MFEKTIVLPTQRTHTEYVTKNVNITENRAPTDASIEMLNEMQKKTEDNILAQFRVETNDFTCGVMIFRNFATPDMLDVNTKYRIGGHEAVVRSVIDIYEAGINSYQDLNTVDGMATVWKVVRDDVAKNIAGYVLKEPIIKEVRKFCHG